MNPGADRKASVSKQADLQALDHVSKGSWLTGRGSRVEEDWRLSQMLYYALVFLVVGLIAGILGLTGVAAIAGQISWILFLVGIALLVIHLISGRRVPPPV